ncbi:MAG: cysteine hydrolase [Firmicutes bacterium]|nr:cysteine hydrolase [Bacillota bacterium]
MKIQFDEKEAARELNCYRIEYSEKPELMSAPLNNDKTLVVVVDMINGFCKKGALASERCLAAAAPIRALLEKLPDAKKAFLRDCHSKNSAEFKWFPPHCDTGKESAVISELAGFEDFDIPKNSTNGFFALQKKISGLGAFNNILVVGVCTDICVMQLCLTLRAYLNETDSGANVVTFTDCVETYDAPTHDAELSNLFALKFLEQAGVQVFKNII